MAAHSASLTSAWLWLLQAAADMTGTAATAATWLEGRATRASADSINLNNALSPSVPEALDAAEITRIAAATLEACEPFDGLVQEDFTLRLLRRLPLGHLSVSARIAVKAHIVRALLAAAGWGSLNDAAATLLQLHFEEEHAHALDANAAAASAARRGSVSTADFNTLGSPLGSPSAAATAAAASMATQFSAADSLAIAEAVLLEPIAVPSPASLVAFLPHGVDALGGAMPAAFGNDAFIITPDMVRDIMARSFGGRGPGAPSYAAPGARAGTLVSPSSVFYSMPSGPWASPIASGGGTMLSPSGNGSGGGGGGGGDPGRFALFGPAAWAALGYTAARSMDPKNCALVLATPAEGLAAHFGFIRGALATAVSGNNNNSMMSPPAAPANRVPEAATPMSPTLFMSPIASDTALDVLTPAHVLAAMETSSVPEARTPAGEPKGYLAGSRASAAAQEIYSVIGRSLLREALAASPGGSSASAAEANDVRFVFVLLDAHGKTALKDPDSGAPLLLRSHAPLSKVEATLGSLARAGRRLLGPVAAAAIQEGSSVKDLAIDLQEGHAFAISPMSSRMLSSVGSPSSVRSPRTPFGSPPPTIVQRVVAAVTGHHVAEQAPAHHGHHLHETQLEYLATEGVTVSPTKVSQSQPKPGKKR